MRGLLFGSYRARYVGISRTRPLSKNSCILRKNFDDESAWQLTIPATLRKRAAETELIRPELLGALHRLRLR